MHLREGQFERAHTDFFEAFKNYDESGSSRRTTCLKYLVLANMLMKSDINPFDSQEAKPFKNDSQISRHDQLGLVSPYSKNTLYMLTGYPTSGPVRYVQNFRAYQLNDIEDFERILKNNRSTIMDDPFIREHIEGLLLNSFSIFPSRPLSSCLLLFQNFCAIFALKSW